MTHSAMSDDPLYDVVISTYRQFTTSVSAARFDDSCLDIVVWVLTIHYEASGAGAVQADMKLNSAINLKLESSMYIQRNFS